MAWCSYEVLCRVHVFQLQGDGGLARAQIEMGLEDVQRVYEAVLETAPPA